EDAEQRIRMPRRIALDELGIAEIIARIHAHALRQAPAHGDLLLLVEERDLDPVDLPDVLGDDRDRDIHRPLGASLTPISCERRIEHLAEPVDDRLLPELTEDAAIDPR